MADPIQVAIQREQYTNRLNVAARKLSDEFDLGEFNFAGTSKDPSVRQNEQLGAIVEFLERLADRPQGDESDDTPDDESGGDDEQGDEQSPQEPTFGDEHHPLSYFDGMTDEEIDAVPGIGKKTVAHIREAQKARDEASE